ncbi:MAG: hypothetical protein WHS77_06720 [Brevinematales bacterium]
MKPEVKDRLITGLAQYLSAQSAGSSRFAVADGYLAIDNYFSAILLIKGIDPTRNHRQKLDLMLEHFGNLMGKAEISKNDLEKFYECWQKVRYSSVIPTPNETLNFLRLSYRVISAITQEIAYLYAKSADELEEELYAEVLGSRWSSFEEECRYIHEKWQQEAEIQGEMGYGSKLGNKMLNPSNFCEIRVLADDPVTKDILANDSEFGSDVAKFYQSFLNLVVQVQNTRHKRGIEPNEVPNFMLSLRMRYHGQSLKEIAEDWGKMLVNAFKQLKESNKGSNDNGV